MTHAALDTYIAASGSSREQIGAATRGAREVVVYCSAMDGLGTPTSDLDIYAIRDPGRGEEDTAAMRVAAGEVAPQGSLDVEWWDLGTVTRICEAARFCRARLDDLKVLHRLQTGLTLTAPLPGGVKTIVGGVGLQQPVITCLSLLTDDELRSQQGFASTDDWRAGLLAVRRAVTYAVMAWCAHEGQLLFKEKWLMTVLQRSWPQMAARYWHALSLSREADMPRILDFISYLKNLFDGPGACPLAR